MFRKTALASFLAALAISPALADTASNGSGAQVYVPLTTTVIQDLYFGTIIPDTTQVGTVKVYRNKNNRSVCSAELTCIEPGNRARVYLAGEPYMGFTVSDPGSIYVTNANGDQMYVDTFVGMGSGNDTSWKGFGNLSERGHRTWNVGAVLYVNPNQPVGDYVGTFTMSVDIQ